MQVVNIHNAKTHLSELIKLAANGEEIIICKSGKPTVKLVQYNSKKQPRKPGYWEGKVVIKEDFDDLPDDFMDFFK
ncbi:MAG: type II toxin-antitoxin system Phd/YefM family antitoxin [Rickettsia endosymbiont of Ixodes persulcatus]|nr:type II toxin-antitoxin system Phd/YefM family antitoxin [Rickettsia endosymbiont of Ixodes persulcatus]MCZ6902999.1 type II toxin-antitoxin system Phd/YefM family antitoxin [Rickettsia endosymbiont of Ixodes persulcatus]MCZ6908469.1 type II toxin-antitoxin system Phd/YefM family antitoxin [Rickettsia endosymbiont of Ixodes persulcatus]MCZ6909932.1 type II toxin-antitoxin system Phd/YefM family antitoxin [Rickettsia endosymbiont of Ixodes persulcatus]MCZ6913581.1 type II toxin-antitoxin syst